MILYKLCDSPFASHSIDSCLQLVNPSDGVLLTEDAVYLTDNCALLERLKDKTHHIYALTPDVEARGLTTQNVIKNVTYSDMVGLCVTYSNVISW